MLARPNQQPDCRSVSSLGSCTLEYALSITILVGCQGIVLEVKLELDNHSKKVEKFSASMEMKDLQAEETNRASYILRKTEVITFQFQHVRYHAVPSLLRPSPTLRSFHTFHSHF